MWSVEQKKGLAIVFGGHLLYGASRYLLHASAPALAAYAVGFVAAVVMIYGSALYVRGKGYAALWGLGGFMPFIGIGTLLLIPPFPVGDPGAPASADETTPKHG